MNSIFKNLDIKFEEINKRGWIKSVNDLDNGVGLTFENLLGKKEDDFSYPDYEGIEIKTQRSLSNYPITLFGLAPWGKQMPEIERLRKTYGYFSFDKDDKLNAEFFASKNILICNRYFFNLEVNRNEQKIYLIISDIDYNVIEKTSYWDFSDIQEKLNIKLKYLAFVYASAKKKFNSEYFRYFKIEYYILKDFETFLNLLENNIISISITTSPVKYGPSIGKNKSSCYFKINRYDLNKLFTLDHLKNYNQYKHY